MSQERNTELAIDRHITYHISKSGGATGAWYLIKQYRACIRVIYIWFGLYTAEYDHVEGEAMAYPK